MQNSKSIFAWVDIPAVDFKRAVKFYEEVLNVKLQEAFPGVAVFPHEDGMSSGGCIYDINKIQEINPSSLKHAPSNDGIMLYFITQDMDKSLALVEKLGGKILEDKETIPWGDKAVVLDSEGNRIVLFVPAIK